MRLVLGSHDCVRAKGVAGAAAAAAAAEMFLIKSVLRQPRYISESFVRSFRSRHIELSVSSASN